MRLTITVAISTSREKPNAEVVSLTECKSETRCNTNEVIIDDPGTEMPDYAVRRLAEFFLKKMREEESAHLQDTK